MPAHPHLFALAPAVQRGLPTLAPMTSTPPNRAFGRFLLGLTACVGFLAAALTCLLALIGFLPTWAIALTRLDVPEATLTLREYVWVLPVMFGPPVVIADICSGVWALTWLRYERLLGPHALKPHARRLRRRYAFTMAGVSLLPLSLTWPLFLTIGSLATGWSRLAFTIVIGAIAGAGVGIYACLRLGPLTREIALACTAALMPDYRRQSAEYDG